MEKQQCITCDEHFTPKFINKFYSDEMFDECELCTISRSEENVERQFSDNYTA